MKAGLYVVGTPIGNMEDITLRALETLRGVTLILTEDTRHTGRLLERHGLRTPMLSCHKFNEASRSALIVRKIQDGAAVAMVTDSGMPGVSDPGARMARVCKDAGLYVTVIPGPSAVTAAVSLCGFFGKGFLFEGFLDHRGGARARRLGELAAVDSPVVIFESPHRLGKLLNEIEAAMGDRPLLVAREMTKMFEEFTWGTAAELRAVYASRTVKGEIVVVVGPPSLTHRNAGVSFGTSQAEGEHAGGG